MNIFSYLKSHLSITDVIGQYTTLKRAGVYFKGRCPFHHEKTASFTISPHIGIFYCFGCHETGDVIAFIAKIEQCSQIDAVRFLADRYTIDLPQEEGWNKSTISMDKKAHYEQVCQIFAQWCHEQLTKSAIILNYLAERGFNRTSVKNFMLGYLPGGPHSIKQLLFDMQKKNILAQDLLEINVLAEGKIALYSPFEDRLLFPIKDALGRVCGFGGRTFKNNDTRPKYYNSRESDFFSKGSLLFGLAEAKKSIQQLGTVYLVEGYTDCIAMAQYDYPNTVATLGTACTLAHLKLLSRYANQVCIMYDSDAAGKQAILRLTELCWQVNMELHVVTLPEGQDPASFLTDQRDLKPYINNAQDIFIFFIKSLGDNFNTKPLNQRMAIIKTLLDTIKNLNDPLKEDILLQKAAENLEIPLSILKNELARTPIKPLPHLEQAPARVETPEVSLDQTFEHFSKLEKKIFCAIMHNMQLFNKKDILAIIDYLPMPLASLLLRLKDADATTTGSVDLISFLDGVTLQQKRHISSLLLEEQEVIDEATFDELVTQLRKKWWKTITHNIKERIAHAKRQGDDHKVQELLNNFVILQQKIMRNVTPDIKNSNHNNN